MVPSWPLQEHAGPVPLSAAVCVVKPLCVPCSWLVSTLLPPWPYFLFHPPLWGVIMSYKWIFLDHKWPLCGVVPSRKLPRKWDGYMALVFAKTKSERGQWDSSRSKELLLCEAKFDPWSPQWGGGNQILKVVLLPAGLCCDTHTSVHRHSIKNPSENPLISGVCSLLSYCVS